MRGTSVTSLLSWETRRRTHSMIGFIAYIGDGRDVRDVTNCHLKQGQTIFFWSLRVHANMQGAVTSGRPCAGILRTSFDAPSHRKSPVFKITSGPLISIHLQLQYYNIRSDDMVPSFEMALKTGDVLYLRVCSRPTSRVLNGVISAMLLTESRRERGWRQLGMFF